MKDLYVLATGTRDFEYTTLVPVGDGMRPCSELLEALFTVMLSHMGDYENIHVVHGGARGVDEAAEYLAELKHWDAIAMPADWDGLGRKAGMVRNKLMVDFVKGKEACCAVILWDGKSNGTANTIGNVKKSGIPYVICNLMSNVVDYSWSE